MRAPVQDDKSGARKSLELLQRANLRLAGFGDFGGCWRLAARRGSHQSKDDEQRYGQQSELDELQHVTSFQHGRQQCRARRHVLEQQRFMRGVRTFTYCSHSIQRRHA
jgi:hypothetical protein